MKQLLPVLALVASVCAGQTADQTPETLASAAESRVSALSRQASQLLSPSPKEQELLAACKINCSTAQVQDELRKISAERLVAMDAVVSQIHAEVDRYIIRTAHPKTPDLDHRGIESGLKQILSSAADMPPVALVSKSTGGYTLIVMYSLHKGDMMGPGATSVTLRSYRARGDRVELVDDTGSDMDGYGRVSVKELPSPTHDDAWILVSGYATGANGPNARMRVYLCNSGRFRTMWMPANVWGDFTVRLTDGGFTVEGAYYPEDKKRQRETYVLAPDGVYLLRSEN